MIYQILLVLGYWTYFLAESVSESWTWESNWNNNFKINPRLYHIWRVVENIGLIGVIILLIFFQPLKPFILSLLSAISGLVIYERIFCLVRYNNFWHQKSSKWFGVGRLPVWVEVLIFIIAIIMIVWKLI